MPSTICFNSGKKFALVPGVRYSFWGVEIEAQSNYKITVRKFPHYPSDTIVAITLNEQVTKLIQPIIVVKDTIVTIKRQSGETANIEISFKNRRQTVFRNLLLRSMLFCLKSLKWYP